MNDDAWLAAYHADQDRIRAEQRLQRQARKQEISLLPHTVYRLYDEHGALLYVGCTSDFEKRVFALAQTKRWFDEVANARLDPYPDQESALAAERAAIETESPRHNGQLNPVHTDTGNMRTAERQSLRLLGKPKRASLARALLANLAERERLVSVEAPDAKAS